MKKIESEKPGKANRKVYLKTAIDISIIYLIFCVIWFVSTTMLAYYFSFDMETFGHIDLYKDLSFVFVTSILLYILLRASFQALAEREYKITRLNRVYAMLSGINSAILRIRDKQKLLEEACRIAAEGDIYQAIGIRLIDFDNNTVVSTARAGTLQDYINESKVSLSENDKFGLGPSGTALREGRSVIVNDINSDPHGDPWRRLADGYGIKACAAIPLNVKSKVIGVLSLYTHEINVFDDDEIRLLNEIAADTSLGLEYIEKESHIDYLHFHDVVTGLPNLESFIDRLNQAVSRYGYHGERYTGVVSISIENFRKIINSFGVYTGDMVLREVATHLNSILRPGDFVAKTGYHDFCILLADLATDRDISIVTHKILSALPQIIHVANDDITLTFRAGVAIHPRDSNEVNELIRYSGQALSSAREQKVLLNFFSRALENRFEKLRVLEQELQSSVENNELMLYYQPIFSTITKKIVSAEVLLRWNNPRLGMVPPAEFIPVAEESGLIIPIGHWLIKQTALQVKAWEKDKFNIHLAINISTHQMRQGGFANYLINTLQTVGLDLSKNIVAIEITESSLIESVEKILPEFNKLKKAGIAISVDDFGTGYSSLSYLRKLPVDVLKIDREFITGLPHIKESVTLVKGIIGLAKGLGLKIVAEGVETADQLSILNELGCDFIQGYLFSKPIPADEIYRLYKDSHSDA